MCHFIGHDSPPPCLEPLYLAVTAAHITHMLRDAVEDVETGYFNIPGEYLQTRDISPQDVTSRAHREWVCGRVKLAREYFEMSQEGTVQVRSLRCRLAGYAYTARFKWMLKAIEHDNFCLRAEYPERKSLWAGLWMVWSTVTCLFTSLLRWTASGKLA
jgi:phytoene/squalene synthetase